MFLILIDFCAKIFKSLFNNLGQELETIAVLNYRSNNNIYPNSFSFGKRNELEYS